MEVLPSFKTLRDDALTLELARLTSHERRATAQLIACLAEFDTRRLHLPLGYSSLFRYCVQCLHLGEGAAYRRIEAARASRRFPRILELIADGAVTLTNLSLIIPHLTAANHETLLHQVRHKKKTEVEIILAGLAPKPDVKTMIRRESRREVREVEVAGEVTGSELTRRGPQMGTATDAIEAAPRHAPAAPAHLAALAQAQTEAANPAPARPVIAPLAPERFKLQITMSQKTHDTLRELQNLMRHSVPSGDVAVIVERALEVLLQEVLRRKCGMRKRDLPSIDPEQPEPGGHRRLIH